MTPTDKPLINLHIDPKLVKRIDDYRFKHRFESRAAAMRWLMVAAMDAKLVPKEGGKRDA